MIVDGLAITASFRFGAVASPGSTFTVPTSNGAGTNFVAGDICFVCQYAEGTTATPPAAVIPAGWTADLNSISGLEAGGNGCRVVAFSKILATADIGNTFTAMNGTGKNRICGIVFHMSRPVQTLTRLTPDFTLTTGNPSFITAPWDSVQGNHVIIGNAHGETSVSDAEYTWSVSLPIGSVYDSAGDGKGSASVTRTYFAYYPYGNDPSATVNMDMVDAGAFSAVYGAYYRLT